MTKDHLHTFSNRYGNKTTKLNIQVTAML